MRKSVKNDINNGYVNFIKLIPSKTGIDKLTWKSLILSLLYRAKSFIGICFIPILFVYGILLVLILRMRLIISAQKEKSQVHTNAISYINEFIAQYPMHLYPVVAKSLELAFIKGSIGKMLDGRSSGIAELAIGDGTLSGRVFYENENVTGFDLNPYSLVHAVNYRHVGKRIVADCLNPPIAPGGASAIVCNNLLHHVTNKEDTLRNWAMIAPRAIFNENTTYWASGWSKPWLLNFIGAGAASEKAAKTIEQNSLQSLWSASQLKSLVSKYYNVIEEESFFSENVFFLSAVCSALLFCYGPPTPGPQKKILNGVLRGITRVITYQMAKALIEYDAILPRDKDSFISWAVESRLSQGNPEKICLVCPDCKEPLHDNYCEYCKNKFQEQDGMLFLLPKELREEIVYSDVHAGQLGKEHL